METTRRYFGLTGSADSKQVSNKKDGVDTLQSCFMIVPLMESTHRITLLRGPDWVPG